MHSLIFVNRDDYRLGVESTMIAISGKYRKLCYISFNDSHNIIIRMLDRVKVSKDKVVVVDASKNVKGMQTLNDWTYIINTQDLFNVYLYLRNLILDHNIDAIFLDSLSALIVKHNQLPLKEMLENLLLEVGGFKCDTYSLALNEHERHEVLEHLNPLIGQRLVL
jgi:hypothetical protein